MIPPRSVPRNRILRVLTVSLAASAALFAESSVRADLITAPAHPASSREALRTSSNGMDDGIAILDTVVESIKVDLSWLTSTSDAAPAPKDGPAVAAINGPTAPTAIPEPSPVVLSSVIGMMVWGGRLLRRIRRGR